MTYFIIWLIGFIVTLLFFWGAKKLDRGDEMPTYRVMSGDMDADVITRYHADMDYIAVMAIFSLNPNIKKLGRIIEIKGGAYTKENIGYVSTEKILKSMGYMRRKGGDE